MFLEYVLGVVKCGRPIKYPQAILQMESLYLYKCWVGTSWLLFSVLCSVEMGGGKKNLASLHCILKAAEILLWALVICCLLGVRLTGNVQKAFTWLDVSTFILVLLVSST